MTVKGLDNVLKNLNREIDRMEGASVAGLMAGGLIIQGQAMKNVPNEYGNLRGSAYTRKGMSGPKYIEKTKKGKKEIKHIIPTDKVPPLTVELGFTASYAAAIHENMEQKLKGQPRPSGLGVYWGPSGGPKFLERAVREKAENVLRAVRAYARVRT